MEKIISFKRYICGYEEFDFSELYKGCSDGIKKLPVNVFLTEHKKFGTILINTGRGPLVNEKDVAEALRSGRLGAYGADVMCSEPPAADNPLLSAPNAYITPHIAWATYEARVRLVDIAIDNVKAFVGGAPINVVNA